MDAIELRPNFGAASSLFSPQDLFANKRAKLGEKKYGAIGRIYTNFLSTVTPTTKEEETSTKSDAYQEVQEKHGLTVFAEGIKSCLAEGAKKLRVGGIVSKAAVKFSEAVAVSRPKEEVVVEQAKEVKEEKPVVQAEDTSMSRTRLHEDTMPIYNEQPQTASDLSSRRLDSYLSKGMAPTNNDQSLETLAAKIDEINAIKAKASSLEAEQSELLAEEEEIDRKLTQAFDNADKDLLSATQSLEKIVASINETQGRLTEKRRMLEQLNKVTR